MSGVHNAAQTTASPSSGPTINTTRGTQDCAQAGPTIAVPSLHSNNPLYDTDDELSEAPESPSFPTLSNSSYDGSITPHSDSDSLSEAPDSPVWPGCPEASPNESCTGRGYIKVSPTPPRCTEKDCPIRKAVRHHNQGPYLHRGKPPRTNDSLFNESNPPPHVWESLMKLQARDPNSTVEDDLNVLDFLRWHVDDPNTEFMGIF